MRKRIRLRAKKTHRPRSARQARTDKTVAPTRPSAGGGMSARRLHKLQTARSRRRQDYCRRKPV